MPPGFSYNEERLDRIINSLSPAFNNVLGPRHQSWWNADVYQKLAQNHIAFCGMSHPSLPDDIIQNTEVIYYRFHGRENLYQSRYSVDNLKEVADVINRRAETKEAWCYFNNDIDANAIYNATEMMALV